MSFNLKYLHLFGFQDISVNDLQNENNEKIIKIAGTESSIVLSFSKSKDEKMIVEKIKDEKFSTYEKNYLILCRFFDCLRIITLIYREYRKKILFHYVKLGFIHDNEAVPSFELCVIHQLYPKEKNFQSFKQKGNVLTQRKTIAGDITDQLIFLFYHDIKLLNLKELINFWSFNFDDNFLIAPNSKSYELNIIPLFGNFEDNEGLTSFENNLTDSLFYKCGNSKETFLKIVKEHLNDHQNCERKKIKCLFLNELSLLNNGKKKIEDIVQEKKDSWLKKKQEYVFDLFLEIEKENAMKENLSEVFNDSPFDLLQKEINCDVFDVDTFYKYLLHFDQYASMKINNSSQKSSEDFSKELKENYCDYFSIQRSESSNNLDEHWKYVFTFLKNSHAKNSEDDNFINYYKKLKEGKIKNVKDIVNNNFISVHKSLKELITNLNDFEKELNLNDEKTQSKLKKIKSHSFEIIESYGTFYNYLGKILFWIIQMKYDKNFQIDIFNLMTKSFEISAVSSFNSDSFYQLSRIYKSNRNRIKYYLYKNLYISDEKKYKFNLYMAAFLFNQKAINESIKQLIEEEKYTNADYISKFIDRNNYEGLFSRIKLWEKIGVDNCAIYYLQFANYSINSSIENKRFEIVYYILLGRVRFFQLLFSKFNYIIDLDINSDEYNIFFYEISKLVFKNENVQNDAKSEYVTQENFNKNTLSFKIPFLCKFYKPFFDEFSISKIDFLEQIEDVKIKAKIRELSLEAERILCLFEIFDIKSQNKSSNSGNNESSVFDRLLNLLETYHYYPASFDLCQLSIEILKYINNKDQNSNFWIDNEKIKFIAPKGIDLNSSFIDFANRFFLISFNNSSYNIIERKKAIDLGRGEIKTSKKENLGQCYKLNEIEKFFSDNQINFLRNFIIYVESESDENANKS